MVAVRAVGDSPLINQAVRFRFGFEVGEVEAPPGRIAQVYDANVYQRGTDQFVQVVWEPPVTLKRPISKGLWGPKFQEVELERLFFRVLQGKLEEVPRDERGNITRIPFRASMEQLLLDASPRLKEVHGFAGVPKDPATAEARAFDDSRDIAPFAMAVALRP
jgi:hypothetical protein